MLASYAVKREDVTAADLGYHRHLNLFHRLPGPVIDSADIRAAPGPMLRGLCDAIGLSFDPAMLAWPPGPKAADGVWAPHWYGEVHRSTGFAGAEGPLPVLSQAAHAILAEVLPAYEALSGRRLRSV